MYFGGAEIDSHRNLLRDANAKHVSMSFMGKYRRSPRPRKPWLVKDKFWEGVSVFLDSGAYTLNADSEADEDTLLEIYEHYRDFVNANLDDVDMVSEFDVLSLGIEWIEEERETFWKSVPKEKFMAIWHPVWGVAYLHEMASRFEIIGIPSTSLEGRELRPVLNSLASKGTRIHGVAMTQKEEMKTIKWDSVASTSWISPQRYGDTIVWTGKELKRFPKKMKDQARMQYRTLFKNNNFDAEAIANDDSDELLRLSIWSWQQFEADINKRGGTELVPSRGVTTTPHADDPPNVTSDGDRVDPQPDSADPIGATGKELVIRPVDQILPVMGLQHRKKDPEDDESEDITTLTIRSESNRLCNTCFLSEKCPGFQPDSNCVYNIPVVVRTREQFKALRYGMVEMQAQRVMFMKMAEDVEGGYADPNLSKEMGLLSKMMGQLHDEEQEGFSLNITARGSSQASSSGTLSRLFGNDVGQRIQELPAPINADDYIEAEIVSDSGE